jgi:hypothetical protein
MGHSPGFQITVFSLILRGLQLRWELGARHPPITYSSPQYEIVSKLTLRPWWTSDFTFLQRRLLLSRRRFYPRLELVRNPRK